MVSAGSPSMLISGAQPVVRLAASLQPAASPDGPSPPDVALLSIGLVRGLQFPEHRRWLRTLVTTIVAPPERLSVFGFYEHKESDGSDHDSGCRANLSWWLDEAFGTAGHLSYRLINSTEVTEQTAGLASILATGVANLSRYSAGPSQFYKTWKVMQMVEEFERARGWPFDLVLRTRIDASGSLTPGWFSALSQRLAQAGPHGVLMRHDFMWLAARDVAGRLARAWLTMTTQNFASAQYTPVDFCAVALSDWATDAQCSNFFSTVRWPVELIGLAGSGSFTANAIASSFATACLWQTQHGWPGGNISAVKTSAFVEWGGQSAGVRHGFSLFKARSLKGNETDWGPRDAEAQLGLAIFGLSKALGRVEARCVGESNDDTGPAGLLGSRHWRKSLDC